MKITVASTLAGYAMHDPGVWGTWLSRIEEMRAERPEDEIDIFCAIERDGRPLSVFDPLIDRLTELEGEHWVYSLEDGRTKITTNNRLRHLTMGQNLATDYAVGARSDWMLFLAADATPNPGTLSAMLEVHERFPEYKLIGAGCKTYGLRGCRIQDTPDEWQLEFVMPTAACVLIHRDVFMRLRWRWSMPGDFPEWATWPGFGTWVPGPGAAFSDDPNYSRDAFDFLGVTPVTRQQALCSHYPEAICNIEDRYHDVDMTITPMGEEICQ